MKRVLIVFAIAFAARAGAHDPITTRVTWSREISRIVDRRCAGCHVAGGVAPMPLQTYEQIKPWLTSVKQEVTSRHMPKWPAARGLGDFENDRSLSPFEIELIAAWVDGGAPKGDARDLAKPAKPVEPRMPAQVFKLPVRTAPPAGERSTVSIATKFTTDRWITGLQFKPNDPAILQAAFTLGDGRYLGQWVPPERGVSWPAGSGVRLAAGATIETTLWYRSDRMQQDFPVGRPSRAPELGVGLVTTPPAREVRTIDARCGSVTATESGELFAVTPNLAKGGTAVGVAIAAAAGPARVLAWVREFDPAYQVSYRLREPVAITAGTRLDVSGGDASCHAYLQYTAERQRAGTSITNGTVVSRPAR